MTGGQGLVVGVTGGQGLVVGGAGGQGLVVGVAGDGPSLALALKVWFRQAYFGCGCGRPSWFGSGSHGLVVGVAGDQCLV